MNLKYSSQTTKIFIGIAIPMLLYTLPYIFLSLGIGLFVIKDIKGLFGHEFYVWLIPLIMYIYSTKVENQKFLIIEEKNYKFSWSLKNLILLFLAAFLIVITVNLFVKIIGFNNHSNILNKIISILHAHKFVVLLLSLSAGITEELVFRGYIFGRLEQLFEKPLIPILISSALFGVVHVPYGTLSQVLFPFLLGVLYSWHYFKYGNIKVLIMSHIMWDFLSLMVSSR